MAKLVRIVLILLGLGPFYASASPVPGELSPRAPPIRFGQISLQGVTYTGSGCPQGAASWSLSDDKQALTVIYDKFIAESGPGIPVTENNKACRLQVAFSFPTGLTYTIFQLDTRGHATTDASTTGTLDIAYGFDGLPTPPGQRSQGAFHLDFAPNHDDDYKLTRALPAPRRVWRPCSTAQPDLIIDQTVAVKGPQGLVTVDTSDLKVKHVFHLHWRRC